MSSRPTTNPPLDPRLARLERRLNDPKLLQIARRLAREFPDLSPEEIERAVRGDYRPVTGDGR